MQSIYATKMQKVSIKTFIFYLLTNSVAHTRRLTPTQPTG